MEKKELRTAWFQKARFGMFIHWGLYAIPGRGEWVRSEEEMGAEEYRQYFEEWNPVRYRPEEWAALARKAGMKYAVLTTKHHDGFCLFDSAYTEFKSVNTLCGRDLVKEYVEAFRKEGLKIGFYYSLLDWNHPDYPAYQDPHHPDRNDPKRQGEICHFDRYLTYLHNQVEELMTHYGKIDIIWFDFSYEGHTGADWKAEELVRMIRRHQPDILINGRLEGSGENYGSIMTDTPSSFCGDFASPEMMIPPYGLTTPSGKEIPWEANFTMNNTWAYVPNDIFYKKPATLIRKLVECVSKNGNMLLNVSPTAKGEIPLPQAQILEEIGRWMRQNAESVYGAGRCPLPKPEWGRYTQKGNLIYAHITEKCVGPIALKGLKGRVRKVRRLSDGYEISILDPWIGREYPDCEFINFGRHESFTFDLEDTPDTVLEIELKEGGA